MKIKPGLEEKWKVWFEMNNQADPYSKAATDAVISMMEALDAGLSPEDAEKTMNGKDLTGFMAGAIVDITVIYNPRGEELKEWWNKRWGAPNAKGAVNPALWVMKE